MMLRFSILLTVVLFSSLALLGCSNPETAAPASFDDPAVAAYLARHDEAIEEMTKALQQGKSDLSRLAELRTIEQSAKEQEKKMLKNMSDRDRAKFTAHMKRSAQKMLELSKKLVEKNGQ